jgi:hypothetical protein
MLVSSSISRGLDGDINLKLFGLKKRRFLSTEILKLIMGQVASCD